MIDERRKAPGAAGLCRVLLPVIVMSLMTLATSRLRANPIWRLDGGDINGDGSTDLGDPIALLGYLFANGPAPSSCGPCDATPGEEVPPWGAVRQAGAGKGDINADGVLDLADPVRLLMYLFGSGPAPEACGVCWPCGPKPLPATGQTTCWDASGEQVPCDDPLWIGEDAYHQIGCPPEGRFVENGNGTVSDNCTGLMWQQQTGVPAWDAEYGPAVSWAGALRYCDELVLAGYDDWRVPNHFELFSLFIFSNDGDGVIYNAFPTVFPAPPLEGSLYHSQAYASSTWAGFLPIGATGHAGVKWPPPPDGPLWLVRCLRGGSGACASRIPGTGKVMCWDPMGYIIPCDESSYRGQEDAFWRAGCALEGRYMDNGDGTITDLCTGLMWEKATAWPGSEYSPTEYGEVTFQEALRYARELRLGGHDDWRLPDIRELFYIETWDQSGLDRPGIYPFEFRQECEDQKPAPIYWSSTVVRLFGYVCFHHWSIGGGSIHTVALSSVVLVRCVRGPIDPTGAR
ncbi:MAG: DUF1566 domain-containing protein [Planctomycetes bacterium]|nr:DUF1566 domain-containing protein [Planctomycetota bacterium]